MSIGDYDPKLAYNIYGTVAFPPQTRLWWPARLDRRRGDHPPECRIAARTSKTVMT
jgi:hypothetical protein